MNQARGERKRRKRLLIVAPSVEHGAFRGPVPHETESADSESGPILGPHPPPPRLWPALGKGGRGGEFRHFGDQNISSAATHTKDFCERNAPKSPDFTGFYF
jgi:hypothetical protein